MPYSAYTLSFTAALGRRASSAALTTGQMAARFSPATPGVTGRGGRLPHRDGGAARAVAEGDELGVTEGGETAGVPVARLAAGCVVVAVAHPAAAMAANKAAVRIFLILLSSPLPAGNGCFTLRTPGRCTRAGAFLTLV